MRHPRDHSRSGIGALNPGARLAATIILAEHPRAYITSAVRTRQENATIKGATPLGHTSRDEFDVGGPWLTRKLVARQLRKWKGAHIVDELHGTGPHVHARIPTVP